jgi:hypothetical protein
MAGHRIKPKGTYTPTLDTIEAVVAFAPLPGCGCRGLRQNHHIKQGRVVRFSLCPGKAAWLTPEDADEAARRLMAAASRARTEIADRARKAAEEEAERKLQENCPYYV